MTKMIAGTALAVVLALPAFAQDEAVTAETVVAVVDGTEITVGHLIAMRALLPDQYQQLPAEVLFDGVLEQLIQQEVIATAMGDDLTPAMQLSLENERRALIASMFLDDIAMAEISDADLQAAYDDAFGAVEPATEYNASHILVESEEDAQALIDELADGADFAELAVEHSIGPSGPNGGQLGWFSQGMMVPAFENAVMALEPGEVSPPVETQFGWHVVILNETREQEPPSLEEVQGELIETIRRDRVDARVTDMMEAANIERSVIEIDPAVIADDSLLTQ